MSILPGHGDVQRTDMVGVRVVSFLQCFDTADRTTGRPTGRYSNCATYPIPKQTEDENREGTGQPRSPGKAAAKTEAVVDAVNGRQRRLTMLRLLRR